MTNPTHWVKNASSTINAIKIVTYFATEITLLNKPAIAVCGLEKLSMPSDGKSKALHSERSFKGGFFLMGIEELRALMGHTNIQTTLCYQKVTPSRAEEVAKKALESLTKAETLSNKIINLHYYISTFL